MLPLLDLIYLGAVLSANIMLSHPKEFAFPAQRDAVVEVNLHREWWREEGKGKCQFTGVMVPFVRDWEQEVPNGDGETRILPPEPNRTAGHAFLITNKLCNSKEPEKILRAGFVHRVKPVADSVKSFPAYDLLTERPELYPKWLAQVVERIERVAETDPKARAFLEDGAQQLGKVLPGRVTPEQVKAPAEEVASESQPAPNQ